MIVLSYVNRLKLHNSVCTEQFQRRENVKQSDAQCQRKRPGSVSLPGFFIVDVTR